MEFADELTWMLLAGTWVRGTDGRLYAHDLSSVPIDWGRLPEGADQLPVRRLSSFVTFSSELLEDRFTGHRMTWAERQRQAFERGRLRNRLRRLPAWCDDRIWAVRRAIADVIYPLERGDD